MTDRSPRTISPVDEIVAMARIKLLMAKLAPVEKKIVVDWFKTKFGSDNS